jgi:hypothetical protein
MIRQVKSPDESHCLLSTGADPPAALVLQVMLCGMDYDLDRTKKVARAHGQDRSTAAACRAARSRCPPKLRSRKGRSQKNDLATMDIHPGSCVHRMNCSRS